MPSGYDYIRTSVWTTQGGNNCPDNVRAGTNLEWGSWTRQAREIVLAYTNVTVTSDGTVHPQPNLRYIDFYTSVPQTTDRSATAPIEAGASVSLRMSGFGYTPTCRPLLEAEYPSEDGDKRVFLGCRCECHLS